MTAEDITKLKKADLVELVRVERRRNSKAIGDLEERVAKFDNLVETLQGVADRFGYNVCNDGWEAVADELGVAPPIVRGTSYFPIEFKVSGGPGDEYGDIDGRVADEINRLATDAAMQAVEGYIQRKINDPKEKHPWDEVIVEEV